MARVHLSDTMRNIHVKSKSFVVVGFVCVLGFAAFTFWGLSTQNSDFLVKIEQLEDNLKISTRKQKDLIEQIEILSKVQAECLKSNTKLIAELKKKETVISAQADEASKWGDRVRNADEEIKKLKSTVADKEKDRTKLEKQVNSQAEEIKNKEAEIVKAREAIKLMESAAQAKTAEKNQTSVITTTQSSSSPKISESLHVLAKPDQADDGDEKKASDEKVKIEDDMELIDTAKEKEVNVADIPKEAREDTDDKFQDAPNGDINVEPDLINSLGDKVEEPEVVDTLINVAHDANIAPMITHALAKDGAGQVPEDQEIDDDRDVQN